MTITRLLAAGVLAATASLAAGGLAPAQAHQLTAPSAPSDVDKAGSFRVTASVNDDEPIRGDRVKIKGVVKPAAPGRQVRLQVRYEGQKRWKTIDTTTLSRASKYKFKDKVGSVREHKYRVVKPAGPNRAAGRSPVVKVTVFRWRPLTALAPVLSNGFSETDQVRINGTDYPDSLVSASAGTQPFTVDYNLNRDCLAVEGRLGVSDASPASGTATVSVAADGVERAAGTFSLTQSAPLDIDVRGVFRITVTATTSTGAVAAVASPRVLCSN